ncbi:MAG: glycosyltransferase family 87 protein [Chloroflexota bacterium]
MSVSSDASSPMTGVSGDVVDQPSSLSSDRLTRAIRPWHGRVRLVLALAGVAALGGFVVAAIGAGPASRPFALDGFGFDTFSYWGLRSPVYPGPGTDDGYGFYRYSPVFLPLMVMFSYLPWPVFAASWIGIQAAAFVWLAGDHRWQSLAFVPVLFELYLGNIHLLLAVALVLGFRWPAAWAFVLLTKITPGVGLLWFAVRREWRSLVVALGATLAITLMGVLVAPHAWLEWYQSLRVTGPAVGTNQVAVPLPWRLVVAALVVIWGARTDRRWTVIVAATLGLPTLWFHGLAMLMGIVALRNGQPERLGQMVDRWRQRLGTSFRDLHIDPA